MAAEFVVTELDLVAEPVRRRPGGGRPAAHRPAPPPTFEAIPVALCSCSPVVTPVPGPAATPVRAETQSSG